jgi:hypothetical protein
MFTVDLVGAVTAWASAPNLNGAMATIRMNGADSAKNSQSEVVDTTRTPAILNRAQKTAVMVIFRPVRHHFRSRAAGIARSSPISKKPLFKRGRLSLTAKAGLAFPKRLSKRRTIAAIRECALE